MVAMCTNELWLVQGNHATVKLDSSATYRGMNAAKAELNCEIYKSWCSRPKTSHAQIFWKLWLQVESDMIRYKT